MTTYTHRIKSIRRRAAANLQAAMLGITVPQLLADVAAGRRFLVVAPVMPMHYRRIAVAYAVQTMPAGEETAHPPMSREVNKQTVHRPVCTGHSKRVHMC